MGTKILKETNGTGLYLNCRYSYDRADSERNSSAEHSEHYGDGVHGNTRLAAHHKKHISGTNGYNKRLFRSHILQCHFVVSFFDTFLVLLNHVECDDFGLAHSSSCGYECVLAMLQRRIVLQHPFLQIVLR